MGAKWGQSKAIETIRRRVNRVVLLSYNAKGRNRIGGMKHHTVSMVWSRAAMRSKYGEWEGEVAIYIRRSRRG